MKRLLLVLPLLVGLGVFLALWWPASRTAQVIPPIPSQTFNLLDTADASQAGSNLVKALEPDRRSASTQAANPSTESIRPNTLRIVSVGIEATVAAMALDFDEHFDLHPPADATQVGLWSGGSGLTAASGTTLVTGHVQTVNVARGALWPLAEVEPGTEVVTVDDQGRAQRWRITDLVVTPKQAPPHWVFAGIDGPRRLVIVTCGGEGQAFNVIARAVPKTPSS